METLEIRPGIEIPRDAIADFCRLHGITWFALFGSVLRDDFGPESDVDVLVEFAPDRTPSLFGHLHLERELSDRLDGRETDLGARRYLNRWIRDRVTAECMVTYEGA